MRIVVLVKEVPDTYGERALNLETGLVERRSSESVVDEIGERALEAALCYADANEGVEVSVLSMAPAGAVSSIRKCLAMGADSATHIIDDGLIGADLGLTAEALAAALRRVGFDLVITGNQSTDGASGMLPALLAETLGVPNATNLDELVIGSDEISGLRASDGVVMRVIARLPALVSVTDRLPDARFANLKGIMAAKKKPIETLDLVDLGIDPEDMSTPRAIMLRVAERPPRIAGTKILDEGDAARELVGFLAEQRLI